MKNVRSAPLFLALLMMVAALGVGCGQDSPLAPNPGHEAPQGQIIQAPGSGSVSLGNGRIAYQPYPADPTKYYKQLFTGMFQDIFSEDPASVDAGFAKLEQNGPGSTNYWFQTWAQQNGGPKMKGLGELVHKGREEVDLQDTQDPQSSDEGGVTICTTVTVTLSGTVKAGSTAKYKNGPFTATHTWNEDSSANVTLEFNFEQSAPAGTNVTNNSTSTFSYDGELDYEAEGGTPSCDMDLNGTVQIDIVTVTKEGEGR